MEIALQAPYRLPRQARAATMRPVSTNELTDAELIIRTGDGDRGAFEVLYQRYARSVFGLALRRLGDRGRAEDAVQETFASIWRAARTYKPERGPGAPWLYAVARNAIVDRGRMRLEPAVETPEEVSGDAGPAERATELDEPTGLPRRRTGAVLALAAALALVAFLGGFIAGHTNGNSFDSVKAVPMHGVGAAQTASGTIDIGQLDSQGNWPL